jgi:hypothetical protein
LALRVVPVAEGYEKTFWNHVNRDPLDYYFFILDLTQRREETKILLAVEDDRVMGACLLYADVIVQLRGSRQAVKLLLDHVDPERVELQAPLDCEDIILTKYKPLFRYELVLMRLTKGEENIQITTVPVRLGPDDAADVVEIMRKADPEWWGELTEEMQRKSLETRFWLGIRQDEKLVHEGKKEKELMELFFFEVFFYLFFCVVGFDEYGHVFHACGNVAGKHPLARRKF